MDDADAMRHLRFRRFRRIDVFNGEAKAQTPRSEGKGEIRSKDFHRLSLHALPLHEGERAVD